MPVLSASRRGCFAALGAPEGELRIRRVPDPRRGQARCSGPVGRPPPPRSVASHIAQVRQPSTQLPRTNVPPVLPPVARRRPKPATVSRSPPRLGPEPPPVASNQPKPAFTSERPSSAAPAEPPAPEGTDSAAPEGTASPNRNQPGSAWWGTPPHIHRQAGFRAAAGPLPVHRQAGSRVATRVPLPSPPGKPRVEGAASPVPLTRPRHRKQRHGPVPTFLPSAPRGPAPSSRPGCKIVCLSRGLRPMGSAATRRSRRASPGVGMSY